MRWQQVRDNFFGRWRLLNAVHQQSVRSALAVVTSANSCSILDFLDGSARYTVTSLLLREMVFLVDGRLRALSVIDDNASGTVLLNLLRDMRECLEAMTSAAATVTPPAPQGIVRGDPSLIQTRSRPRVPRDLTLEDIFGPTPAPRPRRVNPVVIVDEFADLQPAEPARVTETNPQRAARRERGRRINAAMGLRNDVEVEVVRTEPGRFTRVMTYRVRECHETGTLSLVPLTGAEPREGSVSLFEPVAGATSTQAAETPTPSRTDTPRRRLRL